MKKEEVKSFLESKKTATLMTVVLVIACTIIVFHVGEEFGVKKAEVMDHMSGGYYKTLGPRDSRGSGPLGYLFDDQTNTHGVSGKVVSIEADKILVEDDEGIEKTVLVDANSIIKKQRLSIQASEIQPGDFIVVIGTPTPEAQIDAKIIRIIPAPPTDGDEGGISATTTSKSATTTF